MFLIIVLEKQFLKTQRTLDRCYLKTRVLETQRTQKMRALFTKQVFIVFFFFFFLIFRKKNVLEKIVNKHCVSVFLVQSLWIGLICGLSCQAGRSAVNHIAHQMDQS